jgi:hypothetical protein
MTGPKTTEEYFDCVKTLCVALLGEGADADSAVLRVFERMNQSEGGICGDADLYRMVYDTVCSISAGRDDTPTDRAIAASLMRNNVRGALGDRAAVLYRHIYQENMSCRDAAAEMEISRFTAKRLEKKIRRFLNDKNDLRGRKS